MRSVSNGIITVSGITVPQVSTELGLRDFLGAMGVRWRINRNNYRIDPGLYAVGNPNDKSDIFVTANYKLSFDSLRKNLVGIDGWILVLNTFGINVWCAAGKGTFGTAELVNRIGLVSLHNIVSHRRIIVPQLGATGIAAHIVKRETGFNVHYGPVRASDVKRFISDGYRADREMRKVRFGFVDRIKLIPNDLIYGKFYLLGSLVVLSLISGISRDGISYRDFSDSGIKSAMNVFLAYLSGVVITPMALPYIPARTFSLKGFYTGALLYLVLLATNFTGENIFEKVSWFLIITSISSFIAMNFTGSSTYTSLSGVKKEMKISIPVQIAFAVAGLVLQIIGRLL